MKREDAMSGESTESQRRLNVEQCIYCDHYEALGCAGSLQFCVSYDIFLLHDPACAEVCPDRAEIEKVEGAS